MAEEIERYLVLRAEGIGVGGVMNILATINSISVYGLSIIKYPYTKEHGHDHSMVILELKSKSNYDSARWLLFEVNKRMSFVNKDSTYFPKPYRAFTLRGYYDQVGNVVERAILEVVDEPSLILHYMGMIQERIILQKEELKNQKAPEYLETY